MRERSSVERIKVMVPRTKVGRASFPRSDSTSDLRFGRFSLDELLEGSDQEYSEI